MVNCEFEDGGRTQLRHVTTGAIVYDENGRILLVKRAGFLLEGGKWAQPGGYLDCNETVEQGIRREVTEETGYEMGEVRLFRVITHPHRRNEERQNVEFVYLGAVGNKVGEPDSESSDVRWFNLDELPVTEMAFDHADNFALYGLHLKGDAAIPLMH